jgi:glycosidase
MEDQRDDPGSVLSLCRRLIELRRTTVDLRLGNYRRLPTPTGSWAWQRGDQHVVAVNLSDEAVSLETPVEGKVLVGTDPERTGENLDGELPLDPWEGVVLSLSLGAGLRQPGSGAGGTPRPSA